MTEPKSPRRKLSHEAFTECWYVPGETHIVDLVHPDDGLTLYDHADADAIRDRYPGAERMSCDITSKATRALSWMRFSPSLARYEF